MRSIKADDPRRRCNSPAAPLGAWDRASRFRWQKGLTAFARSSNCGLIVAASTLAGVHRELIIAPAAGADQGRRHTAIGVKAERYPLSGASRFHGSAHDIDVCYRRVAYIRTSSVANVGADKESDKRQRPGHRSLRQALRARACG